MGAVFILRRKLDERNLMREDEGFNILHNGVPRAFRDHKAIAYETGRFASCSASGTQ
jgi:hypothetical protein